MKGIQLLDVQTGTLTEVAGLKTGGRGIAWNYNGELLALADGFGVVQVMNKEGKILRSIKKYNNHSYLSLDWHPSKNIIVTGGDEIILFDTSGRQLILINHRKESTGVLAVKWHPSGEFFVSGDYGHENEGKPTLLQFWKPGGSLIKAISGHHSEIRNIRWNNSGTLLATASDALRIYTKNGTLLNTGKTSGYNLWGIGWNSKGTLIITSSFEGKIDLWNNKAKLVKKIIE
jgi:WD40 repeat protein